MIDIALHTLLIAWYPAGVGYLWARERKQHRDRNRGDAPLSPQSRREWRWPAIALLPVYVGLMVYFWVNA